MKIGYPCINRILGCKANSTFRLASYSEDRLLQTVEANLDCLERILHYNIRHGLLFFRITSDLVPFASHLVCNVDWRGAFARRFAQIGALVQSHGLRISMHPDQFVLINALDSRIVQSSVCELEYHAQVLDALGLDTTAKIQIHVGGVYGNKQASMQRFVSRFQDLDAAVRRRLVIENDDRSYTLRDCLQVHEATGIPVLFDSFHHEINHAGEGLAKALHAARATWSAQDGLLMVDYSSQKAGARPGTHASSLDKDHFAKFLGTASEGDFDLMLEIKDKERSALSAARLASLDIRYHSVPAVGR